MYRHIHTHIDIETGCLNNYRGSTSAFQIEVGKWQGVERNERTCKECRTGEVEEVCHWLLQCLAWDHLIQATPDGEVSQRDCFQGQSLSKQAAFVLMQVAFVLLLQHALIILFSTISAQCGVPDLVYDS